MLEIKKNREKDRLDYILYGDLDMASNEKLEKAIENEDLTNISTIRFDLNKLEFIDSTGVGQLIKYYRQYSEQNINMEIVNDNPDIEEILDLIGVREIIE